MKRFTTYFAAGIVFLSISLLWVINKPSPTPAHITIQKINENLLKLSQQEKEYLTNFFKLQFFIDSYGYTIYGTKPMSFELVRKVPDETSVEGIDYMAMEHILDRYRIKEGWDVWQKYANLFPLKGFSLFAYPSPMKETDFLEIVVINHKSFLNAVGNNLVDFQQVLGLSLSPEQILLEYSKGEGPVFNQIRNHDGLFGTLLGFGRDNSWEFMKRGGGSTLEALVEGIDPRDTIHVLPPMFKVLPNTKETIDLRIAYEEQRLFIDTIYQKDDFLTHVLMALCGNLSQNN